MPSDKVDEIKDALMTAYALHAKALGAKAARDSANDEAGQRITAARAKVEELAKKEAARVKELDAMVVEAEKELTDYQAKIRQELGIVVDLGAKPVGGSTRL